MLRSLCLLVALTAACGVEEPDTLVEIQPPAGLNNPYLTGKIGERQFDGESVLFISENSNSSSIKIVRNESEVTGFVWLNVGVVGFANMSEGKHLLGYDSDGSDTELGGALVCAGPSLYDTDYDQPAEEVVLDVRHTEEAVFFSLATYTLDIFNPSGPKDLVMAEFNLPTY